MPAIPGDTVPDTVWTIGHSTRPLPEFMALLARHRINLLLDVRTVPRSRHNPQFNRESLPGALAAAGIGYVHMPELGGLRHAVADSRNTGWRNPSFRGYADYMQTAAFAAGVARVVADAARERCALMCAEAVPWRCHRSLIADALTVRGIRVEDIVGAQRTSVHRLTPFAQVDGLVVTYPPPSKALFGP
ncbi:MAG: DUF488 domain-containing protein [Betaproteobacteria bacterium]|nr:DUF488 domain-containing protein [Betaproteobacteria bacterium]